MIDEFKELACQVYEKPFDETYQQFYTENLVRWKTGPLDHLNSLTAIIRSSEEKDLFTQKLCFSPMCSYHQYLCIICFDFKDMRVEGFIGIPELINESINSCDIDLRPHLYNNIILTGGNTLLTGFADRIVSELQLLAPSVLFYCDNM